jgi:hypothetical protein
LGNHHFQERVMRVRQVFAFLCCAAASACGGDNGGNGGTEPPPPDVEVASVTVTGPSNEGVPGDELQLVATPRNTEGEELLDKEITWATSGQTVASVSATGLVTALAPGTVSIRATSEEESGEFRLEVLEGGRVLPEGGAISAFGGSVLLEVPAGALAAPASITVRQEPLSSNDPSLVLRTGYALGPSGTTFATPAALTVRYAGGIGPSGVPETAYRVHLTTGGTYHSLGGTVDAEAATVTAPITEIGTFTVARAPSETPCTDPEYRQFDFWVGAWNITVPGSPGPIPSDITLEDGGCAVFENFANGNGRSINVYDPGDGMWHQTFFFSTGQRLVLTGGLEGGAMVLSNTPRNAPPGSFERWTWTQLDGGRVRQLQEFSRDGGVTVETGFDGTYVPR